jgi:hypothetical protein
MVKLFRPLACTCLLAAISTVNPGAAQAREIGRYTEAEVKAFCQNIRNAQYLESLGVYGCKWIRDVGSYGVLCDRNGCYYSTSARPQVRGSSNTLRDIRRRQ